MQPKARRMQPARPLVIWESAYTGMNGVFPSLQPIGHGAGACGGVGHHGPDPLAALQTPGIWTTSGGSREGSRPIKHTSGVINRKMVASRRATAFMYISIADCVRALTFYCLPAFYRCSGLAHPRVGAPLPACLMGEDSLNRGNSLPNLDLDSTDRMMDNPRCESRK
jgi:hypothetical protein